MLGSILNLYTCWLYPTAKSEEAVNYLAAIWQKVAHFVSSDVRNF